MALSTKILVKNVTNLSDARYCSGMGVACLCFDINPKSSSFILPSEVVEISEWVEGVKLGYQVGGLSKPELQRAIQIFDPDLLLCTEAEQDMVRELDTPYVLDLGAGKMEKPLEDDPNLLGVILPLKEGQVPDEAAIKVLFTDLVDVDLFFDLESPDTENLSEVMNQIDPDGFVLYGGKEQKPGFKDFGTLAEILEFLEE